MAEVITRELVEEVLSVELPSPVTVRGQLQPAAEVVIDRAPGRVLGVVIVVDVPQEAAVASQAGAP